MNCHREENQMNNQRVPKQMKLRAGELSFNVLDSGSGEPTLLFLHYWGGSARTWNSVTERLSADFRCIAYDQRGWGGSDAPLQGYTLRDLAHDTSEIVRALGIKRFILVGHSMGGKISQLLASERPAGLEKLILVAPAAPTPQNIPDFAREAQLHAYDTRETAIQTIDFLTAHPPSEEVRDQILADNFAFTPQARLAWPIVMAYEDISTEVGKITVPTLVLAGDQDRQDPVEQHKREVLPGISGAQLQIIPDCGHLMPIEQPVKAADAIRSFVRS
jgi:3-oxoadipate enol-lactonase